MPYLPIAVAIVGLLLLRRCWTEFKAQQAFTIAVVPSRRLPNLAWAWTVGQLSFALLLFLTGALLNNMVWFIGAILAGGLTYHLWSAPARLREHGFAQGCYFVHWNSISEIKWDSRGDSEWASLSIFGPHFTPLEIKIPIEKRLLLESFINGASRFEPQPTSRIVLASILTLSCKTLVFAGIFAAVSIMLGSFRAS